MLTLRRVCAGLSPRLEALARNADADDMNYPLVGDEGSLVLFRGRDALHRVTPITGSRERMLAVLA